jgi:zinc transport system substrate-binding protein
VASVPAWASAPEIVVTLKPVHALVAAVMEGAGTPHLLLDGAASPHTYALKPSDVRRLASADVIVRVSRQLEVFLAKPLAQAGSKTRVITLDEVPGMTVYGLRSSADFEAHQHAADEKTPGKQKRSSGHNHDHGPAAQAIDGHLWLDPTNARVAAFHIAEVLGTVAPAEASRFKQNAAALADKLTALDQKIAAELKPLAGRPFIVFHDAYQYLERRYGLSAAGAVSLNPEVPPSALRVSQLRARLAKRGIVCVFAEPQFPPRAIDTIIEGTSVRRATLDPLGAALPAGPDQYFDLMNGFVRDLRGCLMPTER